jgi:hypothetical protein
VVAGLSRAAASKTTDANLFRIELQGGLVKPVVGNNTAVLLVSDARSNRMIDDAKIEIVPWMTMHCHGSSKKPVVKAMGFDQDQVENVYFTMEGDWDLIITIEGKEAKDTAIFSVLHVIKK